MSNKASPNKRMKTLTDFFAKPSNSTNTKPIKKKIIHPIKKYQLVLEESNLDTQVLRRRKAKIIKLEQHLKKQFGRIDEDSKMNDSRAKKLAVIIKSAKKGHKLDFDFSASKKMTDAGFRWIFKSVTKFRHLKTLKLNFFRCDGITEIGLRCLYQMLTKFPRIKVLALSFGECRARAFENGLVPLGESFKRLRTLQILDLNFASCWFTDPALRNIGRNLEKLPLQRLILNFDSCGSLVDEGPKIFSKDLTKMKSLQSLNINLRSFFYSNLMDQLSLAIKNLIYLRDLRMNFDCNRALNDSFYVLLKEMLQVMPYLQSVNFSFLGHEWIRDSTLKLLSEGLRDALSLKSLQLNFRACERIAAAPWSDTSGIQVLSQALGSMTGLENLEVDLSACGLNKKTRDDFKKTLESLKRCRKNIIFRRNFDE